MESSSSFTNSIWSCSVQSWKWSRHTPLIVIQNITKETIIFIIILYWYNIGHSQKYHGLTPSILMPGWLIPVYFFYFF